MNLKELISQYESYNEQEVKDKEMILKYIDTFDDVLTRENEIVHFTCSGLVLNKTRDKVLMVYHNIYNSWSWVGGHADGDSDFLNVAIREVKEETGVKNVSIINPDIIALDVLPVISHMKRGKFVSSHLHVSIAYLLEVDEEETLRIKEDENSKVGWLPMDTFLDSVKEEHMKPIYQKIMKKVENYSKEKATI